MVITLLLDQGSKYEIETEGIVKKAQRIDESINIQAEEKMYKC